jgi:hypothetical protein
MENKLLFVVRALHQRGYPCFARTYVYALGTWRFELYLEQEQDVQVSLFTYSSAGGNCVVVEDASAWSADELASILIQKYPNLARRAFTAREDQFHRWWAVVCLAVGTKGTYISAEGNQPEIMHGHPKFKFDIPPSWHLAASEVARSTLMEYVAKVEEDIKNSLASLAKAGSFAKMFKLLHYFPEFASCSRPDGKSGYTLLHHAAYT